MKKVLLFSGAAALLFGACTSTGSSSMKNAEDSLSYATGVSMGSYIKGADTTMDIKTNVALVSKAMQDAFKGDTSVMSAKAANEYMQYFYMVVKPVKDSIASVAFLAEAEKMPNVKKTPSGLMYEIVTMGDESVKPDSSSVVRVLYKMQNPKGSELANTYTSGDTSNIPLMRVIKGWSEGMKLVGKGGKIKLWIPSELGYGRQTQGPIPGNTALYYEVDLIDVLPGTPAQ